MATFTAHGALGAGTTSAILATVDAPHEAIVAGAVYGFILGIWPDIGDWLAAQFGWYPRWTLYTLYHSHTETHWGFTGPWYLVWQPPFFLHIFTDTWFHDASKPGWNWWPERGWLEILMWAISAELIWYAF
jgi:hypothetical protein